MKEAGLGQPLSMRRDYGQAESGSMLNELERMQESDRNATVRALAKMAKSLISRGPTSDEIWRAGSKFVTIYDRTDVDFDNARKDLIKWAREYPYFKMGRAISKLQDNERDLESIIALYYKQEEKLKQEIAKRDNRKLYDAMNVYVKKFVSHLTKKYRAGKVSAELWQANDHRIVYSVSAEADRLGQNIGAKIDGRGNTIIGPYTHNIVEKSPEDLAEHYAERVGLSGKSNKKSIQPAFIAEIAKMGFDDDGNGEYILRNRHAGYGDKEPDCSDHDGRHEDCMDSFYEQGEWEFDEWADPIIKKVEKLARKSRVRLEFQTSAEYGHITIKVK